MRRNSRALLGFISISVGVSIIISMILPNWIWGVIVSGMLIGCGVLCIYN